MKPTPTHLVYVVADSAWQAEALTHRLRSDERFQLHPFTSAFQCRQAVLARQPALVVIAGDLLHAAPLVRTARSAQPAATVLVVTTTPQAALTQALLKAGANGLLPFDPHAADQIGTLAVRMSSERAGSEPEVAPLPHLLGLSAPMQMVFQFIRKAAGSLITVSIRGETGTGKEEVARAIHHSSSRANGPFVGLNMAAIPRELLESELFGHEKGAFTGATTVRVGHFEQAHGGTLFLDEIADLDLSLQAKLLRVLQERSVTRVGGTTPRPLDVRLIVATHADLALHVRAGTFREDLYYRLLGLPIPLPPLRERGTDILLLANHFLREFCPPGSGGPCRFTAAAERKLMRHLYPGNVRELRAVVEVAAVMVDGDEITDTDINFPPEGLHPPTEVLAPVNVTSRVTLRQHTTRIVQHYLDHYKGNVLAVAHQLGVGKSTLYRMIQSGEVRI
jgi:two-component system, NtrC family, response regulator AtoC